MMPDLRTTNARQVPEGKPRAFSFAAVQAVRSALAFGEKGWKEAAQLSGIVFVLSLGVGTIAWSWYLGDGTVWNAIGPSRGGKKAVAEDVVAPVAEPVGVRRRTLDGVAVPASEGDVERYYGVMIDDITAARPQSGMVEASVVYEAPVEGGLTRWLAVFPDTADLDRIGPVRSARPYFIDWAREYDALYVHVGGSPEALEKIAEADMRDLNEFGAGKYFTRDPRIKAPHNTFVSMEDLKAADAARNGDRANPTLRGWAFKDDAEPEERPATQKVVVRYGHPNVDATWTYDPERNDYVRAQGAKSVDADGHAVRAKNVIVLFTEIATIDAVGRQRVRTVGDGYALVVLDGNAYQGEWRKPTADGRTVLYDASGNEVRLNAGSTWVQIVPVGSVVEVEP